MAIYFAQHASTAIFLLLFAPVTTWANCGADGAKWHELDMKALNLARQGDWCAVNLVVLRSREIEKKFWETCYVEYGLTKLQANEMIQNAATKMEGLKRDIQCTDRVIISRPGPYPHREIERSHRQPE